MFATHLQHTFDTSMGHASSGVSSSQYNQQEAMQSYMGDQMDMDMDMDMVDVQDHVAESYAQATGEPIYIVLDTNVFDHYLDLLMQFVDEVEEMHRRLQITFIVPGVVIRELDGQQKRKDAPTLSRAAAAASRWLASSNKSPTLIREQYEHETCRASGNWKTGWHTGDINDDSIIDCCQYLRQKYDAPVTLWTEDNLLKFRTESRDNAIKILKCPPTVKEASWTCRAVARELQVLLRALLGQAASPFPDGAIERFSDKKPSSRRPGYRTGFAATVVEPGSNFVDRMDVDWVLSVNEKDWLQLDMIERLDDIFRDVLELVVPQEIQSRNPGSSISIYALPWERKTFKDWTLYDRVQYFGPEGLGWLDSKDATNHLTQFLTPTSQQNGYPLPRGKPGNTWTTKDWQNAMKSLRRIGRKADGWEKETVSEYLNYVKDVASAFNLALE